MKHLIISLKNKGLSNDLIYQCLAGDAGLFGVAFFGHKGKKGDKLKLNRIWNNVLKY